MCIRSVWVYGRSVDGLQSPTPPACQAGVLCLGRKSLLMEKNFSGRFNLNMPSDQEAGTVWYDCCVAGGVSPVPDQSWLGKCLAQPTAGQRDHKASTRQLSEV